MLSKKLIQNGKIIDNFLKSYLKSQKKTLLIKPMMYGLLSGGKKIRSNVILATGHIFGLKKKHLTYLCAAVECIHSYSLIHDDLPCMDDDKIRRGKPSTHIKYGEASAILAGNSLLTLAFELLMEKRFKLKNNKKNELVKLLANSAGHSGIAGGQELDLKFENKKKNLKEIIEMQKKKTGKLFNFCCHSIGIIANLKREEKKALGFIGEDIGLLFQLTDDFLDFKGSKKITGKLTNKDQKKGKKTLISLLGYKKSIKYAEDLEKKILRNLKKHGKRSSDLINVIKFITKRNF
tara:strand:+ start:2824 stop:3699 length:876 start_codon:yes stop_codon:yes gene_type:complete